MKKTVDDKDITIKLSKTDYTALELVSKKCGLSIEEFIIQAALEKGREIAEKEIDLEEMLKHMMKEFTDDTNDAK